MIVETGRKRIIAKLPEQLSEAKITEIQVLKDIKTNFPDTEITRMFTISEEEGESIINRVMKREPDFKIPDLEAFIEIMVHPSTEVEIVIEFLKKSGLDNVYYDPPGEPSSYCQNLATSPTHRRLEQFYLDEPPTGINHRAATRIPNSNGEQVRIMVLEKGWYEEHPDLPPIHSVDGVVSSALDDQDHGTRVFGILVGQGLEINGIIPDAQVECLSYDGRSTAFTIWRAIHRMKLGDILLLEVQKPLNGIYHPLEVFFLDWLMIRIATAVGIIVVESAGNGGTRITTPKRDSGAIMVAASEYHDQDDPVRRATSNYGPRIDCFALGEYVSTTAYFIFGNELCYYTAGFGETSAAAAIVAGAAGMIQHLYKTYASRTLRPREMRDLLTAKNNSTQSAPNQNIGVMPDLYKILISAVSYYLRRGSFPP